jgi:hypothetical protein
MALPAYVQAMSAEKVTDVWDSICAVMPLNTSFSTAEATKRLYERRLAGNTFATTRQNVDIVLKRVLDEGSPDLIKLPNGKWILPSREGEDLE